MAVPARSLLVCVLALFLIAESSAENCCQTQLIPVAICTSSPLVIQLDCLPPLGFFPNAVCGSSGTCTTTGGVTGDPVLSSFDNRTFEFFGKPGYNYSLLAGPYLDVNMQLVPAGPEHLRHQGGEGTFVGGMAVVMPSLRLLASVDTAGNMTFAVNHKAVNIEDPATFQDGVLTYEPYKPNLGQVLTVNQSPFKLELVAVKEFTDGISGHNRGHFELRAQLMSKPTLRYSGVLGESLHEVHDAQKSLDEARFEVPSLLHVSHSAPQTTRRLLTLDSFALEGSDFPLAASFGA